MKDKDLTSHAKTFLGAFAKSVQTDVSAATLDGSKPYSLSAAGYVEITDEIAETLNLFVLRAATLLKAKGANEKAISDLAMQHAQAYLLEGKELDAASEALIDEVSKRGNASFKYLAPNYLIRFADVREITIGRVRALLTADFSEDFKTEHPSSTIEIVPAKGFSFRPGPKTIIEMRQVCWLVAVDAVAENVDEEGKWLIDIAMSFLRLSRLEWSGHFPGLGQVEPNPVRVSQVQNEGVKLQGSAVRAGGSSVPPWYEINQEVVDTSLDPHFIEVSNLIFDPQKKSLAERVSQGLGWLTRGRQSADRSERLLFFFTAIEALLSSDDKSAPVVQTIARHAAVILTNDNVKRATQAAAIRKLYGSRSALVHAGTRSVLWSGANQAQAIAENLYFEVLNKADLSATHETFCNALAAASYGTVWPANQ